MANAQGARRRNILSVLVTRKRDRKFRNFFLESTHILLHSDAVFKVPHQWRQYNIGAHSL